MNDACKHNGIHEHRYDDGIEEVNGKYEQVSHPTSGYITHQDRCLWRDAKCPVWLYVNDGYSRCDNCPLDNRTPVHVPYYESTMGE